jgi:hypothetical protein
MATYFVFGNAPKVDDLLDFTGKDESTDDFIKIEDAEDKSGHCFMNINGHMVGAQISDSDIISAIYTIDSDNEGVRLLTILIEQWSEENSKKEEDIATTVIDEEMSIYLEHI